MSKNNHGDDGRFHPSDGADFERELFAVEEEKAKAETARLKAELEAAKAEIAIRDWMIKLALKDIHWISTTVMQKTCNDIETMMDKYRTHAENALADIESEAIADAVQTTTPGSKI